MAGDRTDLIVIELASTNCAIETGIEYSIILMLINVLMSLWTIDFLSKHLFCLHLCSRCTDVADRCFV